MASTANQVIAKFQRTYPDCSVTDAESLLQDALVTVYTGLQIRNTTSAISLTAGTQEYDLNVNATRIIAARYELSANQTTWSRLDATNIDRLNIEEPNWRSYSTNGSPSRYYVTSAASNDTAKSVIGFLPRPGTTSANSYPRVVIEITEFAGLTASETMPSNLPTDDVFVYYMCWKWAVRNNDEKSINKWNVLYASELGVAERFLAKQSENEDGMQFYGPVNKLTRRI